MNNPLISTNNQFIIGNGNQQAARDINNIIFPYNDNKIKFLFDEYKKEQESNVIFNETIEGLNHYLNPIKKEKLEIIGLEQKLRNGNFDAFIEHALQAKEIFVKKIAKYEFSKAAQEIFLYLLADIYTTFNLKIFPLILNKTDKGVIMSNIQNEIIDKIEQKLGENIFNIYSDCIEGMIYFLTGNCHIRWQK